MLQFQIVVNTLKISNETTTVFSISKKDVYYIQTSLNEDVPKISLYNLNVGVFAIVFQAPLSECSDPNGDPFTVNSFTTFAEDNLGFNSDGASSSITVTDSYATLPAPATVSGQFYWCENADGTFPVGLYYSDGTDWQFQTSENITIVANYSALPNPTTVSGQFYWCESAQGTYPVGLYYSNGTVWQFSIADNITVVANYSALPDPTTVNGQFFWAEASQGTSWLPFAVGGTYYSAGMYYSNGVAWSFLDVPYQATQAEVNTGTNTNKFVTPSTLKNQNYLAPLASPTFTGTPSAPTPSANTNSTTLATTAYADAKVGDAIADSVTTVAPSQNAVFDALALKANLASPTFTGTPSAPTPSANTNSTTLATTAYADAKVGDAIADSVTTVAPSQNAVFDALALKQNLLGYVPLKNIISDTVSVTVTGTTSLTLVKTYELTAGKLPSAGFVDLFMYSTRTGTSAIHTMGLYINTTNNFATATLIQTATTSGNFSPILPFKATFILKNNLLIGGIYGATTGTNYLPSSTQTSVACNNTVASVWFFVGITPSNSGQTVDFQAMQMTT
jgi:hypothetical protein